MKVILRLKGGKGSGHHGHSGRPGKHGGSLPGKGGGVVTLTREDFIGDDENISTSFDMYERTAKILASAWDADDKGIQHLLEEEGMTLDKSGTGKEALAYYYIRHWGGSSGGPAVSVIAEHISKKLGQTPSDSVMDDGVRQFMKDNPDIAKTIQSFGDAMYTTTQKWFADRGITHVQLHRAGFKDDNERTLTSWSADTGGVLYGKNRIIREAIVPVKQILSIPSTGFGTLTEREAVVIGTVKDSRPPREYQG